MAIGKPGDGAQLPGGYEHLSRLSQPETNPAQAEVAADSAPLTPHAISAFQALPRKIRYTSIVVAGVGAIFTLAQIGGSGGNELDSRASSLDRAASTTTTVANLSTEFEPIEPGDGFTVQSQLGEIDSHQPTNAEDNNIYIPVTTEERIAPPTTEAPVHTVAETTEVATTPPETTPPTTAAPPSTTAAPAPTTTTTSIPCEVFSPFYPIDCSASNVAMEKGWNIGGVAASMGFETLDDLLAINPHVARNPDYVPVGTTIYFEAGQVKDDDFYVLPENQLGASDLVPPSSPDGEFDCGSVLGMIVSAEPGDTPEGRIIERLRTLGYTEQQINTMKNLGIGLYAYFGADTYRPLLVGGDVCVPESEKSIEVGFGQKL